ncbi:cytochrome P450 [Streptomyces albidus (ex Kaewkla and Franco 2022)]|uniref:cytochrome P450 n=1 Tax=Streptomyces albidus (ex Kaewkla and Franco 2022) TaxID=722709 RepID=UPI001B357B14|nr:cytochrome P450 [Streptomyces albidus (ex Kaewkla and Franco 2022)]
MTNPTTSPPSMRDGGTEMLEWLRFMRDEHPVWQDAQGLWHVFRYEDVQRASTDHAAFSSDRGRVMSGTKNIDRGNIVTMDPPEHGQIRKLISQAFAPRVIAGLAPRITEVTEELLDAASGAGTLDLVDDLAYPLPVIVIAELLGVPTSDRDLFRHWAQQFLNMQLRGRGDPELLRAIQEVLAEMKQYFAEQYRERLKNPGDDLFTALSAAESDGQRLDEEEVVNFTGQLLLAGHVSTTVLLSNVVVCLQDNPEAAAAVRADRSLIPDVVEEALRLRTPSMHLGRITTEEVKIGGKVIPADSIVSAWLLSANHDERHFENPGAFDLDRRARDHLAFGHGVHFCIGASLGRQEGQLALSSLLDRYSDIETVDREKLQWHDNGIMFGPKDLLISVRP